jgi:phospholipid/cholesterol/gamma-HCH transport system ATP-binding protein
VTARAYIEFVDVHKAFAGRPVLCGMSLAIPRGEVLYIIGTSGVGKSVTIKHLVGLLRIDQGEIWFDGARVDTLTERAFAPVRRRIGMVFQSSTLFDSMTLADNVALPLRLHKRLAGKPLATETHRLLELVYMAEHADRFPAELSDGMRKRAAIARTLALSPEVVLFDEPTTGLDPVSARRIDRLIRELATTRSDVAAHDGHAITAVVVSHDPASILGSADRIAFLYNGVVHTLATPDELRASSDPVVQQFIHGRSAGPMDTPGF